MKPCKSCGKNIEDNQEVCGCCGQMSYDEVEELR